MLNHKLKTVRIVWFGVSQYSQESHKVIQIALCTLASQNNMICASTLRYVVSCNALQLMFVYYITQWYLYRNIAISN